MNRRRIALTIAIAVVDFLALVIGMAGALGLSFLIVATSPNMSGALLTVMTASSAVLGMAAADGLFADLMLTPLSLRLRATREQLVGQPAQGVSTAESLTRHIHAAGLTVAGERGGRAANKVTEALGLGRIDYCDNPHCADCAPTGTAH